MAKGAEEAGDYEDVLAPRARGTLRCFNPARSFGFICPVLGGAEAPAGPPPAPEGDGLWFFGSHSLPPTLRPGAALLFDVWRNPEGRAQARRVRLAQEPALGGRSPRVAHPCVRVSGLPAGFTAAQLRALLAALGLAPGSLVGLAAEPPEAGGARATAAGALLRFDGEVAASAAVAALHRHELEAGGGPAVRLEARHADAPEAGAPGGGAGGAAAKGAGPPRRLRGVVARVSTAGYGVIESQELGEVMFRRYEVPDHLRAMQLAHPRAFEEQVQSREEYRRLKQLEGQEVEAEVVQLPSGRFLASGVCPAAARNARERSPRQKAEAAPRESSADRPAAASAAAGEERGRSQRRRRSQSKRRRKAEKARPAAAAGLHMRPGLPLMGLPLGLRPAMPMPVWGMLPGMVPPQLVMQASMMSRLLSAGAPAAVAPKRARRAAEASTAAERAGSGGGSHSRQPEAKRRRAASAERRARGRSGEAPAHGAPGRLSARAGAGPRSRAR